MGLIFKDIACKIVIPYLDDIIIYSKSMEEHKKHVEIVMKKITDAGLILNKSKCQFFKTEIEILGHVMGNNKIKPCKLKTEAINNLKKPETILELRSFL
jgi:hypothetical protein